jgi:hypothetical protein
MSVDYQMYIADRIKELDHRDEPHMTRIATDWGGRPTPGPGFAGYPSGYIPMVGGGRVRDHIVTAAQPGSYNQLEFLHAEDQSGASHPAMKQRLVDKYPPQVGHIPKSAIDEPIEKSDLAIQSRMMSGQGKLAKQRARKEKAESESDEEMEGGELVGGVNRLKKAKRWTNYAVDTAHKGLNLVKKAAPIAAMFAAGPLEDAAHFIAPVAKAARKKAIQKIEGMGELGSGARGDLPAGNKATKAHMKALRDMQGDQKKFEKGSQEAKDHMASIRKKRRTKAELDAERAEKREADNLPPKKARAPNARAAVVKAVMAKHGLKLIEASKYVKANNIPY